MSEDCRGHRLARTRRPLEQEAMRGLKAVIQELLALALLTKDTSHLRGKLIWQDQVFQANGWVRGDNKF
ncbi:MAG: hypothetical protein KDA37_01765 [Planctomycetales bacterium]|nr:hypothetical protein [Planctomycetales bacterium]